MSEPKPGAEPKSKEETVFELSPETLAILKKRRPKNGVGCFLCKLIVLDHEKNGYLTDYPKDFLGQGQFPVEGKLKHIEIEKQSAATQEANAEEKKAAKKKEPTI